MADVGSEWERVAKPGNIIQDVIFFLFFLLLVVLVLLVLIHGLSHTHVGFHHEPTFSRSLKHAIRANRGEARDNHQLTIELAAPP